MLTEVFQVKKAQFKFTALLCVSGQVLKAHGYGFQNISNRNCAVSFLKGQAYFLLLTIAAKNMYI